MTKHINIRLHRQHVYMISLNKKDKKRKKKSNKKKRSSLLILHW